MSLANSSALSCVATAVGCAITGIAVSDQLSQANPEQPVDQGIHQSHSKLAEFMAKARGSEPVAPPGILPIEGMSAAPQTSDLSDLDLSRLEDQPNPLSSPKSTLLALRLPEMPQSVAARVTRLGEQGKFLPDYLNFDTEDDLEFADITEPESFEPIEFEPLEIAIRYTPEEVAIATVPAPPPLLETQIETQEVAAQYIVEPEVVIANNKPIQRSPQSEGAAYIVDPQEVTTAKSELIKPDAGQNSWPAPPAIPADAAVKLIQSQSSLRPISSPIPDPVVSDLGNSNQSSIPDLVHETTLPSRVAVAPVTPIEVNEAKPMPSLLKKLVESNDSSSDVMNDIKGTQSAPSPARSATFRLPQAEANQRGNSLDSVPSPRFEQGVEENQPKSEPVFSATNSPNSPNSPELQAIPVEPTTE
ncbi:MAG: hypothetical protein ACRC8A_05650 [Microcoleaceae cyanobacterium]